MRTTPNALWAILALLSLLASAHSATFTVTTTRDYDPGSFRWAVEQANEISGPDTILFAIPTTDPRYDPELGVWTIESSPYSYNLTGDDGTFIDGLSQRDFVGGDPNPLGPEIQITGPGPNISGIAVSRRSDITIRGLCVNGFGSRSISVSGRPPNYGGPISNITVTGCYLSVDPTGSESEFDSSHGISAAWVMGLRIGGDSLDERNVIAGSVGGQASLGYCGNVEIVNNHIGCDRTGTVGMYAGGEGLSFCSALGPAHIRGNVICGGYWNVVWISNTECDSGQVTFVGNRVGVGIDGTPMGAWAHVVGVSHTPKHEFRDNIIAHCLMWHCMELEGDETDYVTISRNSIYGCARLGINLAQEVNEVESPAQTDYADGVYGPGVNEEIDPCLCDSVVTRDDGLGGTTTVYLTCMRDCTVEVFVGDEPGGNLPCGELGYGRVYSGVTYLGDAEEIVQGAVRSAYRFTTSPALPQGTIVTSTATNANGSTSEFGCSCQVPLAGERATGCSSSDYAFSLKALNPGSNNVRIHYSIPEPARVRIMAYDLSGNRVAEIRDGMREAGTYTVVWNAAGDIGKPLPSGSYLVRLVTDEFSATRKVVIVR